LVEASYRGKLTYSPAGGEGPERSCMVGKPQEGRKNCGTSVLWGRLHTQKTQEKGHSKKQTAKNLHPRNWG